MDSQLNHARGGARAVYNWLIDKSNGGGLLVGNCHCIINPDPDLPDGTQREDAVPVMDHVFRALDKLFKAGEALAKQPTQWQQSRLYVYLAGHGIALDPLDTALLMANGGPPHWWLYHISCQEILKRVLREQPFKELLLFADCCRSTEGKGAPSMPIPGNTTQRVNRGGVAHLSCFATSYGE